MKKFLALMLSLLMVITSIPQAFAVEMDLDASGNSTEEIIYYGSEDEDFSDETSAFAKIGSWYKVTIPKFIVLSGANKNAGYKVSVEGDIAGNEELVVEPDENVALYSTNKDMQIASISQDRIAWRWDEFDTKANGFINASNITAGKWSGLFFFNISLNEGVQPKVLSDICIPDFVDLDDDYRLVLNKIEEPGFYDEDGNLLVSYDDLVNNHGFNPTINYDTSGKALDNGIAGGSGTGGSGSSGSGSTGGTGSAGGSTGVSSGSSGGTYTVGNGGSAPNKIILTYYPNTSYVYLPNAVTKIGSNTFSGTDVKYVHIPSTATSIGDNAFSGTKLVYSYIPSSVKSVGTGAYNGVSDNVVRSTGHFTTMEINLEEAINNGTPISITLEKGSRYQITALYNFYDDVTKESTITSADENIVKFVPDCYLDAINCGTTTISGVYTTKDGRKKDATIEVTVVDTGLNTAKNTTSHTHTTKTRIENRVEPTCTKEGSYEEVTYCTTCDKVLSRKTVILPTTEHRYGEVEKLDATCTESGYTKYTCLDCGYVYNATYTPARGHSYDDGKITTQPTCEETGIKTYTCERCGAQKEETVDALGHDYSNFVCTRCGHKQNLESGFYKDGKLVKSWEELVEEKHIKVNKATDANYTFNAMAATGDLTAKGIDADTLVVDKEVTILQSGGLTSGLTKVKKIILPDTLVRINSTSIGGNELEEIVFPKSVQYINANIFSQDCSNLKAITVDDENEYFDDYDSNVLVNKASNVLFAGCKNSTIPDTVVTIGQRAFTGGVEELTIPASVTTLSANAFPYEIKKMTFENIFPWKTPQGSTYVLHEMNNPDVNYTTYKKDMAKVWTYKHDAHKMEIISDNRTCTSSGTFVQKCKYCDYTSNGNGTALGHKEETDWRTIREVSCEVDGLKEKHCERCGMVMSTQTTKATGHNFVNGVCTNCGANDMYIHKSFDEIKQIAINGTTAENNIKIGNRIKVNNSIEAEIVDIGSDYIEFMTIQPILKKTTLSKYSWVSPNNVTNYYYASANGPAMYVQSNPIIYLNGKQSGTYCYAGSDLQTSVNNWFDSQSQDFKNAVSDTKCEYKSATVTYTTEDKKVYVKQKTDNGKVISYDKVYIPTLEDVEKITINSDTWSKEKNSDLIYWTSTPSTYIEEVEQTMPNDPTAFFGYGLTCCGSHEYDGKNHVISSDATAGSMSHDVIAMFRIGKDVEVPLPSKTKTLQDMTFTEIKAVAKAGKTKEYNIKVGDTVKINDSVSAEIVEIGDDYIEFMTLQPVANASYFTSNPGYINYPYSNAKKAVDNWMNSQSIDFKNSLKTTEKEFETSHVYSDNSARRIKQEKETRKTKANLKISIPTQEDIERIKQNSASWDKLSFWLATPGMNFNVSYTATSELRGLNSLYSNGSLSQSYTTYNYDLMALFRIG